MKIELKMTAPQCCRTNTELILVNKKTVLNLDVLKKEDFKEIREQFCKAVIKKFENNDNVIRWDFVDFKVDENSYYCDMTFQMYNIYDSRGKFKYRIYKMVDVRVVGYTAYDTYYNRPPSISFEVGRIQNNYGSIDIDDVDTREVVAYEI